MINQLSSRLSLYRLKGALNKWRLAFLGFIIVYSIILTSNLTNPPIQWDEVVHLNGGSFLYWGNYEKFILNAFYPPLMDALTYISFSLFGVSLFAARLVPVAFSILSLWTIFELAYRMYDGKTALLSGILLGVMPAYFWLSSLSLLETMLVFFTIISITFFYCWLKNHKDRMLVLSGVALGLGFLTKYQMVVTAIILVFSIIFLARNQVKFAFKKFSLTIVAAVLVIVPWIVIAFEAYASQILTQWVYALQVGNPERSVYSGRFPIPVFYLIEMVWPYDVFHPISLFIYVAGLAGLVYLAWRRRSEDKLVIIWFVCIYVFFTLITNKEWRYVVPLFPALALSAAAAFFALYGRIEHSWKGTQRSVNKKLIAKVAAILLIASMAGAVAYSVYDTYDYVSKYQITIDIKGATEYALNNMDFNKSIMVLCPFNFFSRDMVRFYLWADGDNLIPVFQYPRLPVDTYTPTFNITEFIQICRVTKTQFVFTYEYGGTVPYFNTTLNLQQIYQQLYLSGNFTHINDEATFGANPRRIFVLEFTG